MRDVRSSFSPWQEASCGIQTLVRQISNLEQWDQGNCKAQLDAPRVGNSWNEVKIGYKGMEIECKTMNRRILALWQCSDSMRQIAYNLAIAQSRYVSHKSVYVFVFSVRKW